MNGIQYRKAQTHCMTRHDTTRHALWCASTQNDAIRYTLPWHLEIDIFLKCNSLDGSQQCMFMWNSIHEVLLVCNKWIKVRVSKCDIKLFEGFIVVVLSRKWMTKVIEKVVEMESKGDEHKRMIDTPMYVCIYTMSPFQLFLSIAFSYICVCHSWEVIFHRLT